MDKTAELYEIEQIKKLKHRYFRSLDTNEWALMADCLTEDCEADYDSGKYSYSGRQAILDFFSKFMDGPKFLSLHHGHHPEIELAERYRGDRHLVSAGYRDQPARQYHPSRCRYIPRSLPQAGRRLEGSVPPATIAPMRRSSSAVMRSRSPNNMFAR